LPENSILITAKMQSETDFPSSHQLKSYVASKSRLKLWRALSCQQMLAFLLFTTIECIYKATIDATPKFLMKT